jgi:hypothetical protein
MAKSKFRLSKLTPYKGAVLRPEDGKITNGKFVGTGRYSNRQISVNGKPILSFYQGKDVKPGAKINPAREVLFEADFELRDKKDGE